MSPQTRFWLLMGTALAATILVSTRTYENSLLALGILVGSVVVMVGAQLLFNRAPGNVKQTVRRVFWHLFIGIVIFAEIFAAAYPFSKDFAAARLAGAVGVVVFFGLLVGKEFWLRRLPPNQRTFADSILLLLFWGFLLLGAVFSSIAVLTENIVVSGLVALVVVAAAAVRFVYYGTFWASYLAQRGDVDGAIRHLTQLIRRRPNDFPAYLNRAILYHRQQNFPQSLADYNTALSLAPQNAGVHGSRASAYVGLGDYDAALADCEAGFQLEPTEPEVRSLLYYNRAFVRYLKGDLQDALDDLGQVVTPELPHNSAATIQPMVNAMQAIIFHTLGRTEDAIQLWRNLTAQNPNYGNIEWIRNEFRWTEPMIDAASQLISTVP